MPYPLLMTDMPYQSLIKHQTPSMGIGATGLVLATLLASFLSDPPRWAAIDHSERQRFWHAGIAVPAHPLNLFQNRL